MDIATIIGLIAGIGCFIWGMMGSQGPSNLRLFWDPGSYVLVMGGALCAILISFPMDQVINAGKVFAKTLFSKSKDLYSLVGTLVSMAEKARREGLLALEEETANIEDPFLQTGLQMVVDGTEPEIVRSILEIDLAFLEDRHAAGKKVLDQFGALLPAMGMIGTVMGLIIMLANFSDPSAIGPGMSLAMITTFVGAIGANFIFIPMSNKLEMRHREEMLGKQVIVEGILAIQQGENPKLVEQKLLSFLSPTLRRRFAAEDAKAAAVEA